MVNAAQGQAQGGGNKLLGKFQSMASSPSLSLLARAIPSRASIQANPSLVVEPVAELQTEPVAEPKMSILKKMRQSFTTPIQTASLPSSFVGLTQAATDNNQSLSQLDALDALDQAITEVENQPQPVMDGQLAQAIPQATQQAVLASQPQVGGRALAKESTVTTVSPDQIVGDVAGGGGPAEIEPPKELEIPVEVESYLQKVENHQDQLPQEIVVADDGATISTRPYPKQPVIVLPMTAEVEKVGAAQPPSFSVRWLVEWSRKIMKMFEGMVIYRQDVTN